MTDAGERYWSLCRQLDDLCESGRGESAEAEALRDSMDAPWWEMTNEDARELTERILRR